MHTYIQLHLYAPAPPQVQISLTCEPVQVAHLRLNMLQISQRCIHT